MMRVRSLVPVLMVVLFALVACGGDDASASADTVTDAAGGGDGGADDGGAGIFDSAECAQAVAAWSQAAQAAGAAMSGTSEDISASVDALQAFAASAPEEIRDDFTTVYEAYAAFIGALEDSGYDPASGAIPTAEQIAAIEAASQSLDDAEVAGASERVTAWFDDNCST
jgi:hypothetical protein